MQTILVVDDEPKITHLVRSYLEHAGFRTLLAADGAEALDRALTLRPDLIVLDIMLPGIDGMEVTRRVRQNTNVPIILLTARNDELDRLSGLELGADDYVTKPFSPKELVARVRAVLRRTANGATSVAAADAGDIEPEGARNRVPFAAGVDGDVMIDPSRREVTIAGRHVALTSYQFDLLSVLARRPGFVFSRSALVTALQGEGFESYDRTIDAHMKNLRRALGDSPEHPRYIETVRGVGYRFRDRK